MKTIFLCILFSFLISEDKKWKTLQEGTVLIKVLEDEYPQCSAEIIIDSSVNNILNVIEDVINYKLFFDSIIISKINSKNEVHLAIDMPFPFTNRDYTVKFNRNENNYEVNYLYDSIVSEDFIEKKDYIRLTDAKGGWIISKIPEENGIRVIYKWNGDMKGNFPNWAYQKAWLTQGNEIMLNLRKEVNKRENYEK